MFVCNRDSGKGGGVLNTVGRAVTRVEFNGGALHDPFSTISTSNVSSSGSTSPTTSWFTRNGKPKCSRHHSLSSSVFSRDNNNAIPIWHSSPESDHWDWRTVNGVNGMIEDNDAQMLLGLGSVPSEDEVEEALFALKQVFGPTLDVQLSADKYYYKLDNGMADQLIGPGLVCRVSADGQELDRMEPSVSPYKSRMLKLRGCDSVFYAFQLLQTEPFVQRMVKSLSSDKAVWDAVLNNEVVRELKESFSADGEQFLQSPNETSNNDSHTTKNIVLWIFDTAKARFIEVIEKITKIVNDLFQHTDHNATTVDGEGFEFFHEKLRTSFILSIMILLVVAVNRALRVCHNLTT